MAAADVIDGGEHGAGHAGFKMPPKDELKAVLLDLTKPIAQRMRSIFYLRTIGGDDAVETLCAALANKEGTTLFRHEIGYVLGQMQAASAVPTLLKVLQDPEDDPIVRHECGEALGAIAEPSTLPVLEALCADHRKEVAETCQIAADRVRWAIAHPGAAGEADGHLKDNPFQSVDPAPAHASLKKKEDFLAAKETLLDTGKPLFERYRAMFTLRNNGSTASVKALCAGLKDPSPLFRHEIAYVLGQLANEVSAEALMESTADPAEHEMVRHEAAEALGAIGTPECVEFLSKYKDDGTIMLRESCVVALDIADYWSSNAAEGLTSDKPAADAASGGAAAAAAPAAVAATA